MHVVESSDSGSETPGDEIIYQIWKVLALASGDDDDDDRTIEVILR